jgi:hypothetical protein
LIFGLLFSFLIALSSSSSPLTCSSSRSTLLSLVSYSFFLVLNQPFLFGHQVQQPVNQGGPFAFGDLNGKEHIFVKADFGLQRNRSRCFLRSAGLFSRLTSASLPAFIEMLRLLKFQNYLRKNKMKLLV